METPEPEKIRALVYTTTGGIAFESPRAMIWGRMAPSVPHPFRTDLVRFSAAEPTPDSHSASR